MKNLHVIGKELFITSDEEIKEGDWCINLNSPYKHKELCRIDNQIELERYAKKIGNNCKKIILTTDQDLIADGVQAIDDEFLEWFVKNPSCEKVEIGEGVRYEDEWIDNEDGGEIFQHQYCSYKIIIPKEEPKFVTVNVESATGEDLGKVSYIPLPNVDYIPKQETLEEANWKVIGTKDNTFYKGAKWMQERMYSEEDMREAYKSCYTPFSFDRIGDLEQDFKKWFEQFKKEDKQ